MADFKQKGYKQKYSFVDSLCIGGVLGSRHVPAQKSAVVWRLTKHWEPRYSVLSKSCVSWVSRRSSW